jgi:hypothetical protein
VLRESRHRCHGVFNEEEKREKRTKLRREASFFVRGRESTHRARVSRPFTRSKQEPPFLTWHPTHGVFFRRKRVPLALATCDLRLAAWRLTPHPRPSLGLRGIPSDDGGVKHDHCSGRVTRYRYEWMYEWMNEWMRARFSFSFLLYYLYSSCQRWFYGSV